MFIPISDIIVKVFLTLILYYFLKIGVNFILQIKLTFI